MLSRWLAWPRAFPAMPTQLLPFAQSQYAISKCSFSFFAFAKESSSAAF